MYYRVRVDCPRHGSSGIRKSRFGLGFFCEHCRLLELRINSDLEAATGEARNPPNLDVTLLDYAREKLSE